MEVNIKRVIHQNNRKDTETDLVIKDLEPLAHAMNPGAKALVQAARKVGDNGGHINQWVKGIGSSAVFDVNGISAAIGYMDKGTSLGGITPAFRSYVQGIIKRCIYGAASQPQFAKWSADCIVPNINPRGMACPMMISFSQQGSYYAHTEHIPAENIIWVKESRLEGVVVL